VVVTRADLNHGYQIVQSAHSVADFAVQHPEIFKDWHEQSNSLICLAVPDLNELHKFIDKCKEKDIKYTEFYEPDVNQITSVCLEPSDKARKITSSLKLAGKIAGIVDKHNPNVEQLLQDMSATYQFESQNVLEHGRSVWKYCAQVIRCLQEQDCQNLPIPAVFFENANLLLANLYDSTVIRDYCVWHDCGKPYCKTVDENGKQHFPNHAQVSCETFLKYFPNHPHKETIARLIQNDMDIHLLKDADVETFMQKPIKDICTHLIVGLAELLSNAQMFGGYESTSFKIKLKSLTQRTKKICTFLKS
jgi:peptidyl-tRNA hydrolase